jgi:hypothetical protein
MKKIVFGLVILDLVILNGGVGYLLYEAQNSKIKNQNIEQIPNSNSQTNSQYEQLEDRITWLENKQEVVLPTAMITPTVVEKTTTVIKTLPKTKTRLTQYVTIPGSGSTLATSWVNLSGTDFYLNTADYPGLVEIYFEASMKLFNGNGMAYIRLFDVNHGIGVQGSDISTNSQIDSVLESGKVSFWAGKNLIRVQAKTLTADTTIYSYGRLRVVTEN